MYEDPFQYFATMSYGSRNSHTTPMKNTNSTGSASSFRLTRFNGSAKSPMQMKVNGQTMTPLQMKSGSTSAFQNRSRRTMSSSSVRNSKGKMEYLKDSLDELSRNVAQTRTQTKEMSLQFNFIKTDLLDRRLPPLEKGLRQDLKMLQRQIAINKQEDCHRYGSIHRDCEAIQRSGLEIRRQLQNLATHVCKSEKMLGYYGAKGSTYHH